MTEPNTIGDRLRALRLAKGYTELQVAELIGNLEYRVWLWENNKAVPRTDSLQKLATLYGVTTGEILHGK